MLICPRCNFDGQIVKNQLAEKDGKKYRVLTYACRNRQCSMYQKEIGKEEIEVPDKKEGENNESKN